MEMYCRALAGAEIKLSPTDALVEKNIGWVSNESPTTEGSTVFVPTVVDRYASKEENYAWFKVVSTHQVAHLEFGSFIFEFEREAELFENLRLDLEKRRIEALQNKQAEDLSGADEPDNPDISQAQALEAHTGLERAWLTDMQRFFDLFEDRKLSLDIFTVVEDGRLDALSLIHI